MFSKFYTKKMVSFWVLGCCIGFSLLASADYNLKMEPRIQSLSSEFRCNKISPDQIQCDPTHLQSMGKATQMIKLTEVDSVDFLKIVQSFRAPEVVVGEGSEIKNYKFMSDQIATLFMCASRVSTAQGNKTRCFLYFDPTKKDETVKILENNYFVNIRFNKSDVIRKLKDIFRQNNAAAYVSNEEVQLSTGKYKRASLSCDSSGCELRAVLSGAK